MQNGSSADVSRTQLEPVVASVAPLIPHERESGLEGVAHDTQEVDNASAAVYFRDERQETIKRGGKAEGLPLRWQNLSVVARGSPEQLAPSLASACLDAAGGWLVRSLVSLLRGRREGGKRQILHSNTGYLEKGETLLVLGRPGSGVTTLLRALASDWEGYEAVRGQLLYGAIKPTEVTQQYRGEVCYLSDNDLHFPSLSVETTLDTALRAKTPQTRSIESASSWQTFHLHKLTHLLGLAETLKTPVGNEGLRGVSGGERKRVSIAELLTTRASVMCLDNATNGLDSSTAVATIALLRDYAREADRTVVAGLRQVGEGCYSQFDTVLVLHRGRQAFFGRTSDARAYFEQLGFDAVPGQTTADFVCACTDPQTRRIRSGAEYRVPSTSSDFERAFRASSQYSELEAALGKQSKYEARLSASNWKRGVENEKDRWTPSSSIYTVNFFAQVGFLTRRQYALIRADLYPYVTKTLVNIALSVLVGTLFFQLPATTEGAFTRGSVLLLALLFNGYLQLAELGSTLAGRPIVRRHGQFAFYSPSALALARVISDLPLIAVQVVIFATITYALAGLQRSLERFLIFLLFVYVMALNLTTVFRTFSAISPTINEAFRYCGVALNVFVVYGGFFIPAPSMRPWLRWIHAYLDPVSQAYEAVLSNEFRGLLLECSESDIVPRGPSYRDAAYQTCAFLGSTAGSLTVDGEAYLRAAYDFSYANIWRNLVILLVQAIVFLAIGVLATEYLHFSPSGSKKLFLSSTSSKKRMRQSKREEGDIERAVEAADITIDDSSSLALSESSHLANGHDMHGATLTWRDVTLSVSIGKEQRTLLRDVAGYILPGQVTALLGPSGAGKTTLLNALAGRSGASHVTGSILFDGREATKQAYRQTGFVEQLDLHDDFSTVREALEFSAALRQDTSISKAERAADIDRVLDLMGLTDLQDALVGTTRAGLSLSERKRLTIAVELVSKPKILFLDEPTTGLDSQSAHQLVLFLRKLASAGIPVLATIHQPSAEIFACFDQLLLLERGGRQAYFGGREAAVPFFESLFGPCSSARNPAEYLLDALGAASAANVPRISDSKRPSDLWSSTIEAKRMLDAINNANARSVQDPSAIHHASAGASMLMQTGHLTQRLLRNFYRDTSFSYSKIFTTIAVAVIIGVSFFQQGHTLAAMQNKTFAVFLLLFIPPVFMNAIIQKCYLLRSLFLQREKPAHIYGMPAFCTSLVLADLPYAIGCGLLYFLISYPLVGFPAQMSTILYCLAMVEIFFVFQYTLALALTAVTHSASIVANLLPFFLVSMEAFNGSLIHYEQIPMYWRWLYWLSPFQWYIKGVLGTVLHRQPVICSAEELVSFQAPPGESCSTYAYAYLISSAGYLVDESAHGECRYCRHSTGDEFLSILNISFDDRWLALGIMFTYTITNVLLFFALSLTPRLDITKLWRRRTIAL